MQPRKHNNQSATLGDLTLGLGRTLVLAEAGVNHNGSLERAIKMVLVAKECGADVIKFQTFNAANLVTRDAPKAPYQISNTGNAESQLQMLRQLELSREDFVRLSQVCNDEGIIFMSTPYDFEDITFLTSLDVPAFKVASAMIVEPEFLARIASTGRPILLSTGMATLAEVAEAVSAIRETGNQHIVLLQCTTDYPAAPAETNLRAMPTLAAGFGCLAGFSDHTQGNAAAIAAVALGAVIIEKHFTLDRTMPGPDHASSSSPVEFAQLIREIRQTEEALGDFVKEPTPSELINRTAMRRSIATRKPVHAGEVLSDHNLAFKRPALGIAPRNWKDVVGRRAAVDLPQDQILQWWMLEHPRD